MTAWACCVVAGDGITAISTCEKVETLAVIETFSAVVVVRSNGRDWYRVFVPCAVAVGTSQLHTHLKVKGLFQPKLQRIGTVGGRPIRDASNIFFHKRSCLRVFEVRI